MTINATCFTCRRSINAPDHFSGKRVKCPLCGSSIQIPLQPGDVVTVINNNSPGKKICANCNRELGKLENLLPWNGHEVCLNCYRTLDMEAAARASTTTPPPMANPVPDTAPIPPSPGISEVEARRISKNRLIFTLIISGCSLLLAIMIGFATYTSTADWGSTLQQIAAWAAGLACMIPAFIAVSKLEHSRCPRCKYFGMAKFISSQVLGTSERYQTETKKVTTTKPFGGQILSETEIPVEQRYVRTDWVEFFECKHCRHQWSVNKSREQKG